MDQVPWSGAGWIEENIAIGMSVLVSPVKSSDGSIETGVRPFGPV